MGHFLDDVPESLWEFLSACSSDFETSSLVRAKKRDELLILYRQLLDLRADIVDELAASAVTFGASEDALDDLAESILLDGKAVVREMLTGIRPLPPRARWGRLRGISHIFVRGFADRFGESISEVL